MIWLNDTFVNESEASVSYLDRGYCFGDGVYEVIRVYNGRLYEKQAHYERLAKSMQAIKLALPYTIEQLDHIINELLRHEHMDGQDGTVYMQITRGAAPRTHAFPADAKPVLLAYCGKLGRPHQTTRDGIAAITIADIRWLRCDIKSLNLLGSVLAKQEAAERGVGDAIFHRDGIVTEASSSNVILVKNGVLLTHPANHLILSGITRNVVLRLARELGIETRESAFTVESMRQADELFLTSTVIEVTPVVSVDGQLIGTGQPGPVTRQLQHSFSSTLF
jgi:D-alanine transaminase